MSANARLGLGSGALRTDPHASGLAPYGPIPTPPGWRPTDSSGFFGHGARVPQTLTLWLTQVEKPQSPPVNEAVNTPHQWSLSVKAPARV